MLGTRILRSECGLVFFTVLVSIRTVYGWVRPAQAKLGLDFRSESPLNATKIINTIFLFSR